MTLKQSELFDTFVPVEQAPAAKAGRVGRATPEFPARLRHSKAVCADLREFRAFGTETLCPSNNARFPAELPVFVNEFWTAKQRDGRNLHEISYRACFKPSLVRFFLERFSDPGDRVYDPFMGRGTTLLEAALRGRKVAGCDINPLARILLAPRLEVPVLAAVEARLNSLEWRRWESEAIDEELLVFFHEDTLRQIYSLRQYLLERTAAGTIDAVDRWIQMVATNRLTGHSPGFFSVYTLPPNQATSVVAQRKINAKRQQTPPPRNVATIINKKTKTLLSDLTAEDRRRLAEAASDAWIVTGSADATAGLPEASISLIVTSPPFLNVVDYKGDNWLRCWFNGLDAAAVPIWQLRKAEAWEKAMERVFVALHRLLKPGGWIAFEVGEIRKGTVLMENLVVPAARRAGLETVALLINQQEFTKTAKCWGVDNLTKGTNTNRVIILSKT